MKKVLLHWLSGHLAWALQNFAMMGILGSVGESLQITITKGQFDFCLCSRCMYGCSCITLGA